VRINLEAVERTQLLEFPKAAVLRCINSDPGVARALIDELATWLDEGYEALAASAFGDVSERVCRDLIMRVTRGTQTDEIVVRATQSQVALSVGTAREMVARILRDLRLEGIVSTGQGEIRILDIAKLHARVGRWRVVRRGEAGMHESRADSM
jgi:CRP/FNR family transcriptional regulator